MKELSLNDRLFIIKTLSECSGALQILEIQKEPLTQSQNDAITQILTGVELALDKLMWDDNAVEK